MATRWIITGSHGQLGQCLVSVLGADPAHEVVAHHDLDTFDIADSDCVETLFDPGGADFVVNAAALTAVDLCETEPDLAHRANAEAPALLADRCRRENVAFVHVSTDYVFPGDSDRPYREDDPTGPKSVYGASKLEGEQRVLESWADSLVVRTSWVFGPGKNFVKAILRQAHLRRSGEVDGPLRVVDDQLGCPTYSADLAEGLVALATSGVRGVCHLSNAEPATWWDFAREILDTTGHADLVIDRIQSDSLDLPAPRPAYSVLDNSLAREHGVSLRSWREALAAYLKTPDGSAAVEGV